MLYVLWLRIRWWLFRQPSVLLRTKYSSRITKVRVIAGVPVITYLYDHYLLHPQGRIMLQEDMTWQPLVGRVF